MADSVIVSIGLEIIGDLKGCTTFLSFTERSTLDRLRMDEYRGTNKTSSKQTLFFILLNLNTPV